MEAQLKQHEHTITHQGEVIERQSSAINKLQQQMGMLLQGKIVSDEVEEPAAPQDEQKYEPVPDVEDIPMDIEQAMEEIILEDELQSTPQQSATPKRTLDDKCMTPNAVFVEYGKRGGRRKTRVFKTSMQAAASRAKNEHDPDVAAKLSLSRWMHRVSEREFEGKTPSAFWTGMVQQVGKHRQWLQHIFDSTSALEAIKDKLGLGFGYGQPPRTKGKHGAHTQHAKRGRGKRGFGGGRRNHLLPIWEGVKRWFYDEREQGVFVDREDIYTEFDERVRLFVDRLQGPMADGTVPIRELKALRAAELHIKSTGPAH